LTRRHPTASTTANPALTGTPSELDPANTDATDGAAELASPAAEAPLASEDGEAPGLALAVVVRGGGAAPVAVARADTLALLLLLLLL
jgi:hypothetical protein